MRPIPIIVEPLPPKEIIIKISDLLKFDPRRKMN